MEHSRYNNSDTKVLELNLLSFTLLHKTITISSCPPSWSRKEDFVQLTSNLKISLFQMKWYAGLLLALLCAFMVRCRKPEEGRDNTSDGDQDHIYNKQGVSMISL